MNSRSKLVQGAPPHDRVVCVWEVDDVEGDLLRPGALAPAEGHREGYLPECLHRVPAESLQGPPSLAQLALREPHLVESRHEENVRRTAPINENAVDVSVRNAGCDEHGVIVGYRWPWPSSGEKTTRVAA